MPTSYFKVQNVFEGIEEQVRGGNLSAEFPLANTQGLFSWSLDDHIGEEDEVKMLVMILLGRMITVLVMVLAVMMKGT